MAKDSVADWSTTDTLNTDVGGTNIAEGCAPSGVNDAIRKMMAQIATWAGSLLTSSQAASTYLPLAGGALTGGLTGTTAAFSGAATASGGFFRDNNCYLNITASNPILAVDNGDFYTYDRFNNIHRFAIAGTALLEVAASAVTAKVDLLRGTGFGLGYTGSSQPQLTFAAGKGFVWDEASGRLIFFNDGVAKWSIDSAGNLKVSGNITANTTP